MRLTILSLVTLVALTSCAGYQLNGSKPSALAGIHHIRIPMLRNDTLHPRAEALATSAIADAFVLDGTYKLGDRSNADAILEGTVRNIDYSLLRSSRLDTLRAEELENTVIISWRLIDATDPSRVLARGTSKGTSRFFVDANLQTARNNALPDAMQRAAETLVARLANGY